MPPDREQAYEPPAPCKVAAPSLRSCRADSLGSIVQRPRSRQGAGGVGSKANMTTSQAANSLLAAAKAGRKDEFYTQLSDIEKELRHYTKHFKGQSVLCNCDDPQVSDFFHFFSYNFEKLKLKKLITTCYRNSNADLFSTNKSESGVYLEYNGHKNGDRVPKPEEI